MKWLEPHSKYFLIRFAKAYGSTPTSADLSELASRFGLSGSKVATALKQLVDRGILLQSQEQGPRGRPRICYEVVGEWLRQLPSSPKHFHERVIERLLEHERSATPPGPQPQSKSVDRYSHLRERKQPGRLSVVNRLLLAVLLSRADRFGVVSDLGIAEMTRLTGLAPNRLKSRIRTLVNQGVIRSYIPGLASPFFTRKIPSSYFLNFSHPELAVGATPVSLCVYRWAFFPEGERIVPSIYRDVLALDGDPEGDSSLDDEVVDTEEGALRLLQGQSSEFFAVLQNLLMSHVSWLLTQYWTPVRSPLRRSAAVETLRRRLQEDFRLPEFIDGDRDSSEGAFLRMLGRSVANTAAMLGLELANDYFRLGVNELSILFSPLNSDDWSCALFISGPEDRPVVCNVWTELGGDAWECQSYECEAAMPLDRRYRLNLLTRPPLQIGSK